MDEVRLPRRELDKKPIVFPTGAAQLIIVQRPCVHAIDVEDAHFAHDRCILLPDLAEADDSTPTLDERRLTGLGVIYAALVHAENHPEQKVLVVGHTDPSGPKNYNQELSEKRAKNVQLFITGKRDDWRKHAEKESHPDDVQRILAFQAARGWPCDPGPVTGKMNPETKRAIGHFQLRYNEEVDAAQGSDSPYKAKIPVDEDMGPKTWAAFFDVYCVELMRLLGLDAFADLQAKLAAMKPFDGLPASVGCGENIPFESGRRRAFEPDEKLDRPQHNANDRRVEILFFDPEEKPDLKCHAGGGCNPAVCPLYTKEQYCHYEIGVPRGLKIGEVVMELRFADPEGNTHLLPPGIEVEVRFDDGSTEKHVLLDDARVSFVTARDKSSFDLALTTEDGDYIVLLADGTTTLLDRDGALEKMNEGARFFLVPDAFDTHDADWRVPDDVAFEEGRFIDLDSPATQIGTRQQPAEIVLAPRWQHFRFEYFDRWRGKTSTVPQPRPRKDDTQPLVLEGHLQHVDYANGPSDPPIAESLWDVDVEGETLHCLAWVHRRPSDAAPRELPDKDCLTRFVLPAGTFVRTESEPEAETTERIIETIADGHEHFEEVTKPGVPRLRYYDLPAQWWSRGWCTRLASEKPSATRRFETITEASSKDAPFVIDLDLIVLCVNSSLMGPDGEPTGDQPRKGLTWKDEDTDRFTIWDQQLKVWKPHKDEEYFTDVKALSPTPAGSVLVDHAPFTRLITRGTEVFDVFDGRSPLKDDFADLPVGARIARRYADVTETPFYSFDPSYKGIRADDTNGHGDVGDIATMVLRCCGRKDETEIFRVAQYAAAFFDFAPKSPKNGTLITPAVPAAKVLEETRKSLIASMKRWNGDDMTNQVQARFEVGPKDKLEALGMFHALLVRGHDGDALSHYYRIDIVADQRAFMLRHAAWERRDMQVMTGGSFTAAHEWGHAFGNPDHYIERSYNASLYGAGIRDRWRSPGCPYSFDTNGMMNGEQQKPRGYDMWQLALWMVEPRKAFADRKEIAVQQGRFRYTTTVTSRDKSRALFPVVAKTNQKVGAAGLCDLFAYAGGVDGFNGGDALHGATVAEPWDLVVIVRVKLALTLKEGDDEKFEGGWARVQELQGMIDRIFNDKRRLVARGTFEGKDVRAIFRFSPRFIVRTYPKGDSDERKKYIKALELAKDKKSDYKTKVDGVVTENGVHCEVTVVKKPDHHGITDATASPRKGNVDTTKVEDDVVAVFGSLIGLRDPARAVPNDYAPLANLLGAGFARRSLEFVP